MKVAPKPTGSGPFTGRANQLDQIIRKKFGAGTMTYPSHGYAASKPGYTEAHAIDIGPIGMWGLAAEGKDRELGNKIARFLVHNYRAFGLHNVIWFERMYSNGSWKPYDWRPYYDAGYGSRDPDTHKHVDHLHAQLDREGLIGEYEDV